MMSGGMVVVVGGGWSGNCVVVFLAGWVGPLVGGCFLLWDRRWCEGCSYAVDIVKVESQERLNSQ